MAKKHDPRPGSTIKARTNDFLVAEYPTVRYFQIGGKLVQESTRSRLSDGSSIYSSRLDGTKFARVKAPSRADGTVHWSREGRVLSVEVVKFGTQRHGDIQRLIRAFG